MLSNYKILVVLTGDFNINLLAENQLQQSYFNIIFANGLELLSRIATRITGETGTYIDRLLAKKIEKSSARIL